MSEHEMQVSGQNHVPTALTQGKGLPLPVQSDAYSEYWNAHINPSGHRLAVKAKEIPLQA
jgi:hypothetical protein